MGKASAFTFRSSLAPRGDGTGCWARFGGGPCPVPRGGSRMKTTRVFARRSRNGGRTTAACLAAVAVLGAGSPVSARQEPTAHLEHRFADARGVAIEYFRFGSSGTPIVVIQDHHDYFHDDSGRSAPRCSAPGSRSWRASGRGHSVIAPVRRGWGESDDPGWGLRRRYAGGGRPRPHGRPPDLPGRPRRSDRRDAGDDMDRGAPSGARTRARLLAGTAGSPADGRRASRSSEVRRDVQPELVRHRAG